jgi:hypothetical protein
VKATWSTSTLVLGAQLVNVSFHRELYGALSLIATNLDTQVVRDWSKVMTLELGEDLLLERSHLLACTRDGDKVVDRASAIIVCAPQHLFWGHFHQNFDRNHQKAPPRHPISISGAPQTLVLECSSAEVVLQRNFQLRCSQHRPHLILSDHHHLISPTPTPTPGLPALKAPQLHQFVRFLLSFLVS